MPALCGWQRRGDGHVVLIIRFARGVTLPVLRRARAAVKSPGAATLARHARQRHKPLLCCTRERAERRLPVHRGDWGAWKDDLHRYTVRVLPVAHPRQHGRDHASRASAAHGGGAAREEAGRGRGFLAGIAGLFQRQTVTRPHSHVLATVWAAPWRDSLFRATDTHSAIAEAFCARPPARHGLSARV